MSSKNFIIVPTIQVRYQQLLVYNKFWFDENYVCRDRSMFKSLSKENKTYSGLITVGAKKRMSRSIDYLLMISPVTKIYNPIIKRFQTFQLNFITLTISDNSQIYDCKYCYENLLNPFLKWLNYKYKKVSYIWKVELQERGQPHYHITINQFISHEVIRNKWNELQMNCNMLADFINKFGHNNPNSTDIHAVYKVNDIKKYLLKYLSKNSQNQVPINSKIWDCSENLKSVKAFELEFDDFGNEYFIKYFNHPDTTFYQNEHCEILGNKNLKVTANLNHEQKLKFNEWYSNLKK